MTPEKTEERWLLAGQSNMEGMGDLAEGPVPDPRVRAFTLARRWESPAREPLHWLAESPDVVHHGGRPQGPEESRTAKATAVKGVGPGLWFAQDRAEATGRPQALVCAAHGGTSLSQWLPQPGAPGGTTLYDSMLESVRQAGGPVTGVLWYQGCNDATPDEAACYAQRMKALVESTRRDLGQPDLPWVVVQIGRTVGRVEDQVSWNAVQEAQRRLPDQISHLEVVAAVDLELDDWIHLSSRGHRRLAKRLNLAVRHLVDADPAVPRTPTPVAARWETSDPAGGAVRIQFAQVSQGWTPGELPRGFSLVDSQGRDLLAVCRTRIEGTEVVLRTTTDELGGATVAYAQGCDPAANLVDGLDRALPAFRGLVIDRLPPVTGWFRSWEVCPLPDRGTLAGLEVPPHRAPGWVSRVNTGWWYLVLSDLWDRGAVAGRARFRCAEAMDLEVRAGNDVPMRLFLDGRELVSEDTEDRLTGTNIAFEHHRVPVSVAEGTHEVTFLARKRQAGGLGLDLRLARIDASGPLPDLGTGPHPFG